jgi:CheY-like chemotaxis protein
MARLLVVDDDPAQTKIWQLLMEASGHQVATAETVPQAIEQLSAYGPDVLVMDLRLPGLKDGLELIRQAGAREATKIVVMSGWPRDLETLPEERLVSRILGKPVRPAALLRTITELTTRTAGS